MNGDEIKWKEPGGRNGALAKLNPQWFAEIKLMNRFLSAPMKCSARAVLS